MTERREALVSATPLELRVEQRGAELDLVVAGFDPDPDLRRPRRSPAGRGGRRDRARGRDP